MTSAQRLDSPTPGVRPAVAAVADGSKRASPRAPGQELSAWTLPLAGEAYDRGPITEDELRTVRAATAAVAAHNIEGLRRLRTQMPRVTTPLRAVMTAVRMPVEASDMGLLRVVASTGASYFQWDASMWVDALRSVPHSGRGTRPVIAPAAYLLCGVDLTERCPELSALLLARRIFGVDGEQHLASDWASVLEVIYGWGISRDSQTDECLRNALARLALFRRDPRVATLTYRELEAFRASPHHAPLRSRLGLLSRALVELGVLDAPLPSRAAERAQAAAVAAPPPETEWERWITYWHGRTTLESKESALSRLRVVGRWVAERRPQELDPATWTDETAAALIRALEHEIKVGQYNPRYAEGSTRKRTKTHGEPLAPRTRIGHLACVRIFFRELRRWRRLTAPGLDIGSDLRAPRKWKMAAGPDPRDVETEQWVKLVYASLNLSDEDLAGTAYPPRMIRAMAQLWTHAGLRTDEYHRLRNGCTLDVGDHRDEQVDGKPLRERIAYLLVPVGKTAKERSHPIPRTVGDAIRAWEAERPKQPRARDRKTNQAVDYLFAYRGKQVGFSFWNGSLIPLLCRKAGVPLTDRLERRITGHRGRSSVATWLYNTREGMTLEELMLFLGHADPSSTLNYVRASPIKKARSYARAHASSYLQTVLVDEEAIKSGAAAKGAPYKYYPLSDGSLCSNPAWSACAHRFACKHCDFNVPAGSELASALLTRGRAQAYLEEMPLSEDEREVVEGDLAAWDRLIARLKDVPTPDVERGAYRPVGDAPRPDRLPPPAPKRVLSVVASRAD